MSLLTATEHPTSDEDMQVHIDDLSDEEDHDASETTQHADDVWLCHDPWRGSAVAGGSTNRQGTHATTSTDGGTEPEARGCMAGAPWDHGTLEQRTVLQARFTSASNAPKTSNALTLIDVDTRVLPSRSRRSLLFSGLPEISCQSLRARGLHTDVHRSCPSLDMIARLGRRAHNC